MMLGLTDAHQRQLLVQLDRGEASFFVPIKDIWSRAAFRRSLATLFLWPIGVGASEFLFLISIPLGVVGLPFFLAWWVWRQGRPVPGWRIDFLHRRLLPEQLPGSEPVRLDEQDLGIHCHGGSIELTHPQRGPLALLFQSAPMNKEDAQVLNLLAERLAQRLGLRVVGLRANRLG